MTRMIDEIDWSRWVFTFRRSQWIIGIVSRYGGAGTIVGTAIDLLIIAILTTDLVMLNVPAFWHFIVVGVVVILAVLIGQSRDLIFGRSPFRGSA